jgi:hypothetical protein
MIAKRTFTGKWIVLAVLCLGIGSQLCAQQHQWPDPVQLADDIEGYIGNANYMK